MGGSVRSARPRRRPITLYRVRAALALSVGLCSVGVSTAAAQDAEYDYLWNAETGKCMATPDQEAAGTPVVQKTCGCCLAERVWSWRWDDPRYGGTYQVLRNGHSGLCARPKPGSLDLAVYDCAGSPYVKRPVYGANSGWFQIYNRDAGTCLAVSGYGNDLPVFEWWCIDGNNAEVWKEGLPPGY
jgi:hypothetical protein